MLIRWILNHLLFCGTLFAAGTPAVGGGAAVGTPPATGGEGGGGTTDAGSGGGKVIPGTEAGTDGEDTATDEFGSFDDFDSEAVNQDNAVLDAGDADEFGPNTYKTVKEALKANPEVFKQVKKAVSMVKRYQEHFDSPEAAGELLTDIQTLGGWDSVKQEMGETATFLNGWNAGDGAVIEKWLDDNGDGLTKNMPTILDRWQKSDPQGWAHDAAGTFMATMMQQDESGMSPMLALTKIGEMEGVKDSAEFKAVMRVIKGVQATAKNAPAKVAAKGPDEGKLTAREQSIKQQEQNLQRQALGGKAAPILNKEASNALTLVAGSRKLSDKSKGDLIGDIHKEFARLMEKDAEGKGKRQKLLTAGQHDQWLKMVKSAAARTMPLAARNVWRKYAGIAGISAQQKQERKAEGQQRHESGAGATTTGMPENKAPEYDGQGRTLVDKDAMIRMFGSRSAADDAFLWGSPKHGGKKVWIRKGDGKLFTY